MITVKRLIKLLQAEDEDRIVIMSSDSEGNSYSPLASLGTAAYRADTTWSGEVGMEKLTSADKKAGYTEEDVLEGGKPALILQPTN